MLFFFKFQHFSYLFRRISSNDEILNRRMQFVLVQIADSALGCLGESDPLVCGRERCVCVPCPWQHRPSSTQKKTPRRATSRSSLSVGSQLASRLQREALPRNTRVWRQRKKWKVKKKMSTMKFLKFKSFIKKIKYFNTNY